MTNVRIITKTNDDDNNNNNFEVTKKKRKKNGSLRIDKYFKKYLINSFYSITTKEI